MRSYNPRLLLPAVAVLLLLMPALGLAADDTVKPAVTTIQRPTLLVSDEPNTLGTAEDGYEGVAYMDFNLSLRYPLAYESRLEGRNNITGLWMPYFSFTGRMSQYFNRRSAPVVTKRFNPKFMVRVYGTEPQAGRKVWVDDYTLDYYDVGYAHESNGQYVNSAVAFNDVAANFGSTDIAQDYVHRGWDYLDYRRHLHFEKNRIGILDLELKYFLKHGLAQKTAMDTYAWETPRTITYIGQVDGIRMRAGVDVNNGWFKNAYVSWITGYRNIARYNTFRIESTFTPLTTYLGVPVVLWWQTGYDNSVARFYQHSWYAGIAFSFETME